MPNREERRSRRHRRCRRKSKIRDTIRSSAGQCNVDSRCHLNCIAVNTTLDAGYRSAETDDSCTLNEMACPLPNRLIDITSTEYGTNAEKCAVCGSQCIECNQLWQSVGPRCRRSTYEKRI